MPVDLATRPADLRRELGLSRERMARLLDVSTRTVERWEERDEPPASRLSRERLLRLRQVIDLGLAVYTPEGFVLYLKTPLPAFGGKSALQLMESGDLDRVVSNLAADAEGLGY